MPPGAAGLSRVLLAVAAVLLFVRFPLTAADAEEGGERGRTPEVFQQIDSMLEDLTEIMGFGPLRPVKFATMSKAQFHALYRKRMKKEHKPREIRREVLFLRLFGLVPEDFDYEATVLNLLGEQAWALYDYKRRFLYLADWAPPDAQQFALLHELVHAVDDQHFNLMKYVDGATESEQQLARMAAVEGQASWVMTEWAMRQSDRSLVGNRLLAITAASATRFEASQFPVYDSTPLYFRESLIFPYTDGLLFQHAMIERFGADGLKRVFRQPPETTQQVLQPELYLQAFEPRHPDLPAVDPPRGFKSVYDGTFGQLDHRILLEHHLGDDDRGELLDKWRGSRFEVLERRRTGEAALRYAVRWADEAAAREYFHLYREVCERKWSGLELVDHGTGRCEGTADLGHVVLELDGEVVRSTEGLPPAAN